MWQSTHPHIVGIRVYLTFAWNDITNLIHSVLLPFLLTDFPRLIYRSFSKDWVGVGREGNPIMVTSLLTDKAQTYFYGALTDMSVCALTKNSFSLSTRRGT